MSLIASIGSPECDTSCYIKNVAVGNQSLRWFPLFVLDAPVRLVFFRYVRCSAVVQFAIRYAFYNAFLRVGFLCAFSFFVQFPFFGVFYKTDSSEHNCGRCYFRSVVKHTLNKSWTQFDTLRDC